MKTKNTCDKHITIKNKTQLLFVLLKMILFTTIDMFPVLGETVINIKIGNSLAVQCLRLCVSTIGGTSLILGLETKILQDTAQPKKKT